MNISDEMIVSQIVAGDTAQFEEIMQRYEARLLRYVVYLIHDEMTARDVVQETFIKTYQHLRGFNAKYKFSSWIYRIAHNEAMNAVKKYHRETSTENEDFTDESYDIHMDEILDKEIVKDHVQTCLAKLQPKYREVIQLVYFEGMKYEDISDILQIPSSTVGVRLSRAKAKLKVICQQQGVKR